MEKMSLSLNDLDNLSNIEVLRYLKHQSMNGHDPLSIIDTLLEQSSLSANHSPSFNNINNNIGDGDNLTVKNSNQQQHSKTMITGSNAKKIASSMTFVQLPHELIDCIMLFLDAKSVSRCGAISRTFRTAWFRTSQYWKNACNAFVNPDQDPFSSLFASSAHALSFKSDSYNSIQLSSSANDLGSNDSNNNSNADGAGGAEMMAMMKDKGSNDENVISVDPLRNKSIYYELFTQQVFPIESKWDKFKPNCRTLTGHTDAVTCLGFNEEYLISGSLDGSMIAWSSHRPPGSKRNISSQMLPSFHPSLMVPTQSSSNSSTPEMGVSSSSVSATTTSSPNFSESAHLLKQQHHKQSRESGVKRLHSFNGHGGPVFSLSVDQDYVLSGSYDRTLKLWDIHSSKCLKTFRGHTGWVSCVGFKADYRAISGSWDGNLLIWDTRLSEIETNFGNGLVARLPTIPGNDIYSMHWLNNICITGCKNGLQIHDLVSFTRVDEPTFSEYGTVKSVRSSEHKPNVIVLGLGNGSMKIRDRRSQRNIASVIGLPDAVLDVQYDGEHRILAASGKLINYFDFRMLRKYYSHTRYLPGNGRPSSENESTKPVRTLNAHPRTVFCIQFDATMIISGSADDKVRIFDFT